MKKRNTKKEIEEKIEQKEYSNEEMKEFHKGYNFVNILRNLILVGNMREYISKYQDVQALNDQTRYFRQAKKAIKRAIHSEYMANEDKKIIMNFKKEFDKYEIEYEKFDTA